MKKNHILFIYGILFVKILVLCSFSSDYQNSLFIPFVKHFIESFDNPWQYFYTYKVGAEFPYHPVMLYLLSIFYSPVILFKLTSVFATNFLFKLPILLSDLLITLLLYKQFPCHKRAITIYYFASPVIFYAGYIHSQLDILPTAILFYAVYLIINKKKIVLSGIILGLAIATKSHIIAAFPLMLYYCYRHLSLSKTILFFILPLIVFFTFLIPYLSSPGYINLVLSNPKQLLLYDFFIRIDTLKIYPVIIAILFIYFRFFSFRKINNELLLTFLGMLFAVFVLLVYPGPAWYIWMLPFIAIFFIRYSTVENNHIEYAYWLFNAAYLIFFILFYIPEFKDIIFLIYPVSLKIPIEKLSNISYTLLESSLFIILYFMYRFGVKSNQVYKKNNSTIIAISGDSGSGKSTLLQDIKCLLGDKILELEGDADHKWERSDEHWNSLTHLNPKANLLHEQADNINMLKRGLSIQRRDYDHSTGKFTSAIKLKAKDYILLSGLHTFYLPKMRKLVDLKIFIDTDPYLQAYWKMHRDINGRGYTKEKVLVQMEERSSDAVKYIKPQKDYADLIVNYFVDGCIDLDQELDISRIMLKIQVDASVRLEGMLSFFAENKIKWDYSDDLKYQILLVNNDVLYGLDYSLMLQNLVMNSEEIVPSFIKWQSGYRGFVQLVFLLVLCEKLKESL